MGITVRALAIFLRSGNSTFAQSGWFMPAWSHIYIYGQVIQLVTGHTYHSLVHYRLV